MARKPAVLILSLLLFMTMLCPRPPVQVAGEASIPAVDADFLRLDLEYVGGSDQKGAQLGASVAIGDLNGDGYADVAVGAPKYDVGGESAGAVFIFLGRAGGLAGVSMPDWAIDSPQKGADFGAALAMADVDGDGYADLLVGAPKYQTVLGSDCGSLTLYLGGPHGLAVEASWSLVGDQQGARLGYAVAIAGDVNGNGYDDVIVGAPYHAGGGRAYVLYGSEVGLSSALSATLQVEDVGLFGAAVGTAGDVNGDGFADVIVGAPSAPGGGRAYVFLGAAGGIVQEPVWIGSVNQTGAQYGYAVGTAGDVDGDGYDDIIVGAASYCNTLDYEGAAFVYRGEAGGPWSAPVWTAYGGAAGVRFGAAVGTAGDVNGDGFADVIVGAPYYSVTGPNSADGAAFVFLGRGGGLPPLWSWRGYGGKADTEYGSALAAGDVNGDGFSDLAIGAPRYKKDNKTVQGKVFGYLGAAYEEHWHLVFLPLVCRME